MKFQFLSLNNRQVCYLIDEVKMQGKMEPTYIKFRIENKDGEFVVSVLPKSFYVEPEGVITLTSTLDQDESLVIKTAVAGQDRIIVKKMSNDSAMSFAHVENVPSKDEAENAEYEKRIIELASNGQFVSNGELNLNKYKLLGIHRFSKIYDVDGFSFTDDYITGKVHDYLVSKRQEDLETKAEPIA